MILLIIVNKITPSLFSSPEAVFFNSYYIGDSRLSTFVFKKWDKGESK